MGSSIRLPLFIVDLLLMLASACALGILVTGGDVFFIAGVEIRAHHARNLIAAIVVLGALRGVLARSVPLLGRKNLDFRRLPEGCAHLTSSTYDWLQSLDRPKARRLLMGIIVISAVVKLLNGWFYYGFFSGDDVEIHEMTFSMLFDWEGWQAWGLRSAFYPMLFIYPVQSLLYNLGIVDEAILVFGGRVIVTLFSLLSIALVYQIGRMAYGNVAVGFCSAAFFAASHLHNNFASSVLPRTVAATFVLMSIWLLLRFDQSNSLSAVAGVVLGVGASVRFSEIIFIVCAVLYLAYWQRFLHALLVGIASLLTLIVIAGASDLLWWGAPFYSLLNLARYTLVEGQSSRGYQPAYFYLTTVGSWGNLLFAALALYAIRLKDWGGLILAILPIAMLSALPHKEFRYLVPVLPFVCILAAHAFWVLLKRLRGDGQVAFRQKQIVATTVTVLLMTSLLFEMDDYRFRRYESAVDAARFIRNQSGVSGVAIEQLWRAGGRIYLWRLPTLVDISSDRRNDADYLRSVLARPDLDYVAFNAIEVDNLSHPSLASDYGYLEVSLPRPRQYQRYVLYKKHE